MGSNSICELMTNRTRKTSAQKDARYDVLLTPPGQDYYVPYWLTRRSPQWETLIPKGLLDRRWRNTYYAKMLTVDKKEFMSNFERVFRENVATRGIEGSELKDVVDDGVAFIKEVLSVMNEWTVESLEEARTVIEDSTYEWASEAHRAFDVALDA